MQDMAGAPIVCTSHPAASLRPGGDAIEADDEIFPSAPAVAGSAAGAPLPVSSAPAPAHTVTQGWPAAHWDLPHRCCWLGSGCFELKLFVGQWFGDRKRCRGQPHCNSERRWHVLSVHIQLTAPLAKGYLLIGSFSSVTGPSNVLVSSRRLCSVI